MTLLSEILNHKTISVQTLRGIHLTCSSPFKNGPLWPLQAHHLVISLCESLLTRPWVFVCVVDWHIRPLTLTWPQCLGFRDSKRGECKPQGEPGGALSMAEGILSSFFHFPICVFSVVLSLYFCHSKVFLYSLDFKFCLCSFSSVFPIANSLSVSEVRGDTVKFTTYNSSFTQ